MELEIRFYGVLRKRAGGASRALVLKESPTTVGELRAALDQALPELGGLASVAIAIDEELRSDSDSFEGTTAEEVALLPPVSGG